MNGFAINGLQASLGQLNIAELEEILSNISELPPVCLNNQDRIARLYVMDLLSQNENRKVAY